MNRRQYLATLTAAGAGMLAGCSGGGSGGGSPEYSGTVSDDAIHNLEPSPGETIRVEAENVEGPTTVVTIMGPDGESVLQERVDTEATLTHTVERSGVYRVVITSTGTSSYEIYVDAEE